MRTLQYTGPFKAGDRITIPAQYDYTYTHIGIQVPYRPKIEYLRKSVTPDLTINGEPFFINYNNVLEFDGLNAVSLTIVFNKALPENTIIDIAYQTVD